MKYKPRYKVGQKVRFNVGKRTRIGTIRRMYDYRALDKGGRYEGKVFEVTSKRKRFTIRPRLDKVRKFK